MFFEEGKALHDSVTPSNLTAPEIIPLCGSFIHLTELITTYI